MADGGSDQNLRARLIDAAAELLDKHGAGALSTRRVATHAGTSTMAVYTHFGSMEHLRVEVRRRAFLGLLNHLRIIKPSDDPVADLTDLGFTYCLYAAANAQLYRATFLAAPIALEDQLAGVDSFQPVVEAAQRCIDAGRFAPHPAVAVAVQCWTAVHGAAMLQLSGMLELTVALDTVAGIARAMFAGLGDQPERAAASVSTGRDLSTGRCADLLESPLGGQ